MFELKVMEPAAFKFDYIAAQAGQSSAGMPENGCRTRRREEAESFSKKFMKVTSVAWQPHATLHATLHDTVAGGLQCCVRRLPCSLFCLVLSCVQVKGEAHWGNYEKNRRWN